MIVSVIGYYVYRDDKEPISDAGLWAMYESDDLDAVLEDFKKVGEDLLFDRQLGEDREIEFGIDKADILDSVPKMWKNRVVTKL